MRLVFALRHRTGSAGVQGPSSSPTSLPWASALRGLAALLLVALPSRAEGACALRLFASFEDGTPSHGELVELLAPGGRVVRQTRTQWGSAEVCDFGFGEHSLVLAKGGCHTTVVSGITAWPERTRVVRLTRPNCEHDTLMTACYVRLRVLTDSGEPLSGAVVRAGVGVWQRRTSDYGRLTIPIAPAHETDVTVTADGYLPQSMRFSCGEPEVIEREIRMLRSE